MRLIKSLINCKPVHNFLQSLVVLCFSFQSVNSLIQLSIHFYNFLVLKPIHFSKIMCGKLLLDVFLLRDESFFFDFPCAFTIIQGSDHFLWSSLICVIYVTYTPCETKRFSLLSISSLSSAILLVFCFTSLYISSF
jgi:hypothetical protein